MLSSNQYQLLDFGDGRKLERFGEEILDRPSPPAEVAKMREPALWQQATATYHREAAGQDQDNQPGVWTPADFTGCTWPLRCEGFELQLKASPYGHVGVFPEQAQNWDWIAAAVRSCDAPPKVLNLFAYTGGSTLAAAAAGAGEVVHVDSARNTIRWARRNAELSGLADAPIRWIAEDAWRFVKRELRRGNHYDGVILDPPSYGHGPHGQPWWLKRQLPELLAGCAALLAEQGQFLLLTCHTPGYDERRLDELLTAALGPERTSRSLTAGPMTLQSANGRQLPAGYFARWPD